MNKTSRRLSHLAAFGSVVYLTLAQPTPTRAGGFTTARFGGEHGTVASDSLTSIFYNPAGLALTDGTRIYLEGTFAYRTADYTRDAGDIDHPGTGTPDDGTAANAGPAHLANPIASPFFAIATDFGKKGFTLALGVYVPFGGQAKWDKNDAFTGNTTYPGAVDGTQRWAIVEGQQRSIYGTLAAAWRTDDRALAFGVGLNLVANNISLTRARNATGSDDLVSSNGVTTEGRSLLEVSNVTPSIGLGIDWQASRKVRVGVSYQSVPNFGKMALDGTLTNKFGSAMETVDDVTLIQRMPDVARIGFEMAATPTYTIRAQFSYEDWGLFGDQCLLPKSDTNHHCTFNPDGTIDPAAGGSSNVLVNLARNYKSTYEVRAGGEYHKNKLAIGYSLTFDTNAVPDATIDPSLMDMNKLIPQLGVDYAMGKLGLHATLADVIYFSRTTTPRVTDPAPPSENPDMAGTYKQNVAYLLFGISAAF